MKNAKIFTLLCILALVSVRIFVFSTIQSNPSEQIRIAYQRNLEIANESISNLKEDTDAYTKQKVSLQQLKTTYLIARKNFKKVEFLLEYFSHQKVKGHLNGPLATHQLVVPKEQINQQGLQALDEMIFGNTAANNPDAIAKVANSLEVNFNKLAKQHKSISISDINIFEATRDELIRLFTLGLSGFDAPSSENAFVDAVTVLETLQASVNLYINCNDQHHQEITSKISESFNKAIVALKQSPHPHSFDRIHFLRNSINPLYKSLYQLQIKLGYEGTLESTDANILDKFPYDEQEL